MLSKFRNKLQGDANLKDLLKGSAITFVLKMSGMGLGYVLIYLISQKLGAEGVGFYNLMLQVLTVLGMVLGLGMNMSVLRYVGQFDNDGERHKMHDLYRHFVTMVGPLTIVVSLALYFTAPFLTGVLDKEPEYAQGLRLVAIVLPFFTINQISVEFIRGLRKLQISELVRSVTRPLIITVGIVVFFPDSMSHIDVIYWLVISLFINFFISQGTIWNALKKISRQSSEFSGRVLAETSFPMMITGAASSLLLAAPVVLLDFHIGQRDAGIYSVAVQISNLVSLPLIVVNTIAAPKFAELYWERRLSDLQDTVSKTTRIMFWSALVIAVVTIIFSSEILSMFQLSSSQSKFVLIILVLGQLFNAFSGSVGLLLNMTGNEKLLRNTVLTVTVLYCVVLIILVPAFSVLGAAIANLISIVVLYSTLVFIARKKLQVMTAYVPFNETIQ